MADTILQVVVSPFLGVLFDNLTSLVQKEVGLLWGVDKEMKKLANALSTIQDVLEDAEEKQVTSTVIQKWLLKLKNAAYDADDILDEWATETMQLDLELRQKSCSKQVFGSFFSCFQIKQVKFRHKISKKMAKLGERFDEIVAERSKFHLTGGIVESRLEFYQSRETSSILIEPHIYGRDVERETIVGILLNNVNNVDDVSILPILGIGGVGKTTVAQLVYNDERVKGHFEVRVWVCVSDVFDVKRLAKAVIGSISAASCDLEDLDPLQCLLQKRLAGKRFLLVLDDVWNENQEDWNKFRYSLRYGDKGSSIVVSTRLATVASIVGTYPPYSLRSLSNDDCWSLFKQCAFGMGNEETPNLVKIGKEIVKKCGGVPLAAKALGGIMRFKVEEKDWMFVRDSEIWDLPQSSENTILPALRLSYTHLPLYLRQCFSYCSVFPKNYIMGKDEIVHLWMANNLIQSKEGRQLEDVGNEIFYALLWRSFFQEVEKDEDNNIVRCKMHDIVHDLACSIMSNECSIVEVGRLKTVPRCTRHMSLILNDASQSSVVAESIYQSSSFLRTLLLLDHSPSKLDLPFNFSRFKSLRALNLECTQLTVLSVAISNLIHLRYLNLSRNDLTFLPECICELRNLQTLKLEMCYKLQNLPKYMKNMSSLRHLNIRKCESLTEVPAGMGQMTCLQTLSLFIVGSHAGCSIKELQGLNGLRGELKIKGFEHVKSSIDAKEANLIRKQYLRSLNLAWSEINSQEENEINALEGLQPPQNIKRLSIEGYQGLTFPGWLSVSCLPNLVSLFISKCRCRHLKYLGSLPFLKTLRFHTMLSMEVIDKEGVVEGFPSLEELQLHDMPKLEDWSVLKENSGGEVILLPSLKKLIIRKCPTLRRLPLSLSLECLDVGGCNEIVLRSLETLPYLTTLQSLYIWSFKKLKSLPLKLGELTKLTKLEVFNCKELLSLPNELRNLCSLRSFKIRSCRALIYFPVVGRSSLQTLRIEDCCSLTTLSEGLR